MPDGSSQKRSSRTTRGWRGRVGASTATLLQAFQVGVQRPEVRLRQRERGHLVAGLEVLWIADPPAEVFLRNRAGCEGGAGREMRQVRADLPVGVCAADLVATRAGRIQEHPQALPFLRGRR